jgi:CTP:molybdopterin cytidylyltransferase MocA
MSVSGSSVGVIVLAAGSSSRMDAEKLMMPLDGRPVLEHLLASASAAGLPALVVTRPGAADIAALAGYRGASVAIADDHIHGIAHSISAGLAAVPNVWNAAIIAPGDMPLLSPALFSALVSRSAPDRVVVPVHGGRPGNPVSWGRNHFPALQRLTGDRGGRQLFGVLSPLIEEFEWPDPLEISLDIDTPAALERARAVLIERRP